MKWYVWVIIALVAVVVMYVILHKVNRYFRSNYGFSLYGGALLLLVAAGGIGGGAALFATQTGGLRILGVVLILVGAVALIGTLVFDFKRCGGKGLLAFICQFLFCVPALFCVFDVVLNKGHATVNNYDNRSWKRRREADDDYKRYEERNRHDY